MTRMYQRTTRACTLEQLRPELLAALQSYVERLELGDILSKAVATCETTSVKLNKSFFEKLLNKDTDSHTAVVLTPHMLLWSTVGANATQKPVTLAIRLSQAELIPNPFAHMVEDSSLHINGPLYGSSTRGSVVLPLGDDPDGLAFKEALKGLHDAAGA